MDHQTLFARQLTTLIISADHTNVTLGTNKYKIQLNKQEDNHLPQKKADVGAWSIYLSVAS
jgi:hypothetical protein